MAVRSWRGDESANADVRWSRIKLVAQFAFILFVYSMLIFSMTIFLTVGGSEDLNEALKESDAKLSTFDVLKSVATAAAFVVLGNAALIKLVRRSRTRSSALTTAERWFVARADSKSRRQRRQAEMDSWRNQIIRETYAQVMEQQERGLLCPNCKGQDPGHRKSA